MRSPSSLQRALSSLHVTIGFLDITASWITHLRWNKGLRKRAISVFPIWMSRKIFILSRSSSPLNRRITLITVMLVDSSGWIKHLPIEERVWDLFLEGMKRLGPSWSIDRLFTEPYHRYASASVDVSHHLYLLFAFHVIVLIYAFIFVGPEKCPVRNGETYILHQSRGLGGLFCREGEAKRYGDSLSPRLHLLRSESR